MPEAIPSNLRAQLLPSPLLSVSEFLQYPLPTQLLDTQHISDKNNGLTLADFGYWAIPESRHAVHVIKALPIPPESLLSDILASTEHLTWTSVRYAHLAGANESYFPPWIITYWAEVARLHNTIRRPWLSAEMFLRKAQQIWKTPETRPLCDAARIALLQLPWGENTVAFGADNESTHLLAHYLSNQWLQDTHIHQQLEVLRLDLNRAGIIKCELLSPFAFEILKQMYRTRESIPYRENNARRNMWGLGEEITSGRRTAIAGVANINGNHWVAIFVDAENFTIKYGDSFGDAGMDEVVDALSWWLQNHCPSTFKCNALPITQQIDTFSCGVLSIDAIRHAILPDSTLIQATSATAIIQARINMFIRVAMLDSQYRVDKQPTEGQAPVASRTDVAEVMSVFTPATEIIETLSILPIAALHSSRSPQASPQPPSIVKSSTLTRKKLPKSADLTRWFKPATSAEAIKADRARLDAEHQATMDIWGARDRAIEGRKRARKTENATERQARKRQRDREEDIAVGRRDHNGQLIKASPALPPSLRLLQVPTASLNVAEASRPKHSLHEQDRQQRGKIGRPRTVGYKEALQTNWMSPLLWTHIERVGERCLPQMSPMEICRELKKIDPVLFKVLCPQTLRKWIDTTGESPTWSARTLERVAAGYSPGGITTRVGVLIDYPAVTATILTTLRDLRTASVALTLTTIRGIIIGLLQHSAPEIFTKPSKDGTLFRASEEFVRSFLRRALGWSLRRSTRAGGKLPADYEKQLQKAYVRMAYCIKDENIPSALIVNSDQTQLTLAQGCHMTYAEIGSRQVSTVGAEEKRAITVMASLSNDGALLPFQAIYQGKTASSQPSKKSRSYREALAAGFLFESSNTATYWSTQETMRSFVTKLLAPYFKAVKVRLGLPLDQCSLWQIDCWSVHRSDEFLEWMRANHPLIIINFVPARMTGHFQPADVGLQRLFKHSMKRTAHNDVVQEVLGKLKDGISPTDISIDAKLSVLRDRTVHWMWQAFCKLNKPAIIKKAWEMCRAIGIDDANLSYESLTSTAARDMLRELPITDPNFFAELTRMRNMPPVLSSEDATLEDVEVSDLDIPR